MDGKEILKHLEPIIKVLEIASEEFAKGFVEKQLEDLRWKLVFARADHDCCEYYEGSPELDTLLKQA